MMEKAARYAVVVQRVDLGGGDFWYTARHPELFGCLAQERTVEEVLKSLDECRELWLEAGRSAGIPDPEPFVICGSGTIDFFSETFTR